MKNLRKSYEHSNLRKS